ncbi:hypothetical protein AB4235_05585 [Vibrio cyclitrophicus]
MDRVFSICHERLSRENPYPPELGELSALLVSRTKAEIEAAFLRWSIKQPEGKAEKWVFEKCTWNLKRVRAGQELIEFTKHLKQADELEAANRLVLPEDDLLALPVNSAVSLTDKKREEFTRSGKKSRFSDRINKLVKTHRPESS